MTKLCPVCDEIFETKLHQHRKTYCSIRCYDIHNNKGNAVRWREWKKLPKKPPNTKCPCGTLHYVKGYTMRDRKFCEECREALENGFLHDTVSMEHIFHG
jgi:hypothetical protein